MKRVSKYFSLLVLLFLVAFSGNKVYAETNTDKDLTVSYNVHAENLGWMRLVTEDSVIGTIGQGLRIESFNVKLSVPQNIKELSSAKIKYKAHIQDIGWSDWVYGPNNIGTTGQSKRIEAVQIQLENVPAGYHVAYQVHVQNKGWMPWTRDGQVAGTTGESLRIEAIRIKIERPNDDDTSITYQSHVQNIGWQGNVNDGNTSGTEGKNLRLEAIKLSLAKAPLGMSLSYQTHVENLGWQPVTNDGALSGTIGQSLRVEAIKIWLNNVPPGYHVQYQAHVQNIGWMPWVEDGQVAGTTGQGLRLEAIRVRFIKNQNTNSVVEKAVPTGKTLAQFLQEQKTRNASNVYNGGAASDTYVQYYATPEDFKTPSQRYQFLTLDTFRSGINEFELNLFLLNQGSLSGQAKAFIDAARQYNVDTLYLVAHAIWETGHGTSQLSNGVTLNVDKNNNPITPTVVYNFWGIGAYDSDPVKAGAKKAYTEGWTNKAAAINGGAKWISEHYIHATPLAQNTLYKMRWNYAWDNNASNGIHQYATDAHWARGISGTIDDLYYLYRGVRVDFEYPVYN
ncbi:hypothetical protein CSC2_44570 [Clostridium zeae]|uniref:Mannosyl-glycoprotein endo-beta-N-acetylglucosamidase-like domain-containing protein n=1 Tax=Clostridium zeae TaxID=2759022 RepID=A0ABQ1EGJ6_9CLOT|nr:glucosaminidase domain-containing protein [Clostridium zeae]GFZ33931.1 hypothetical protein CSC2_44570 [Clostridium zeae]